MLHTEPKRWPAIHLLAVPVIGLFALAIVGVFAVDMWQNRSQRIRDHWPQVLGRATTSRVVKEPPTEAFHTTMYVGQCSVEYIVEGKTYSLWAGSGYLDPDPTFMSERLDDCIGWKYIIRYNPRNPNEAYAQVDSSLNRQ